MRATNILSVTLAGAISINVTGAYAIEPRRIVHPGLLHTDNDFIRIKGYVAAQTSPQYDGWLKLAAAADADYTPNAQSSLCRGSSDCTQNYASLYKDVAAAYANALVWRISGTTDNANAAGRIMDAWSSTLTEIIGSADRWLAAGIYGYQLANVAEILRDYDGWTGLDAAIDMLVDIFYPMNHDFLVHHNGARIDNYWANVSSFLACWQDNLFSRELTAIS